MHSMALVGILRKARRAGGARAFAAFKTAQRIVDATPDYTLPVWYDDAHAREFATEYLTAAEVEATIARYIEVKTESEPLRDIPANELIHDQWLTMWAADDELNELYGRLDRACALVYLPDGYRPPHLDYLAEAHEAEAVKRGVFVNAYRHALRKGDRDRLAELTAAAATFDEDRLSGMPLTDELRMLEAATHEPRG
jgi:hypothetical protein